MKPKTRYSLLSGAQVLAAAGVLSGLGAYGYALRPMDENLGRLHDFAMEEKDSGKSRYDRMELAKDPELQQDVSERILYLFGGSALLGLGGFGLAGAYLSKKDALSDKRFEEFARNHGF